MRSALPLFTLFLWPEKRKTVSDHLAHLKLYSLQTIPVCVIGTSRDISLGADLGVLKFLNASLKGRLCYALVNSVPASFSLSTLTFLTSTLVKMPTKSDLCKFCFDVYV